MLMNNNHSSWWTMRARIVNASGKGSKNQKAAQCENQLLHDVLLNRFSDIIGDIESHGPQLKVESTGIEPVASCIEWSYRDSNSELVDAIDM